MGIRQENRATGKTRLTKSLTCSDLKSGQEKKVNFGNRQVVPRRAGRAQAGAVPLGALDQEAWF